MSHTCTLIRISSLTQVCPHMLRLRQGWLPTFPCGRVVEVEAAHCHRYYQHYDEKDDHRKSKGVEFLWSRWCVWMCETNILPACQPSRSKVGINSMLCDLQSQGRWGRVWQQVLRRQCRNGCGDQDAESALSWRSPTLPSQTWTLYLLENTV